MQLVEPQRGVALIQSMNSTVSSSQFLFTVTSVLADALVFVFPFFLVAVYIVGIKKDNNLFKEYALRIVSSSAIAIIINIIIQLFFNKARPETALEGSGRLLLKHLPTMSFPSDHAAVSMAFGIATYYFAHLLKMPKAQKIMKYRGIFFIAGSIVMSVSRVAVGIHWPTDVLAGRAVGFLAMAVAYQIPKNVFTRVIRLEKKILGFLYK